MFKVICRTNGFKVVPFSHAHRHSVSGYDLLYGFDFAAEESISISGKFREWLKQKKEHEPTPRDWQYHNLKRLEVLYKAFFYFLRVYHDEVNAILLKISGCEVGPKSSMNSSIRNDQSPVTQAILPKLPNYPDWFRDMRNRRNFLKEYGDFDFDVLETGIRINWRQVADSEGPATNRNDFLNCTPVDFDEYFTDALQISTKVCEIALEKLKGVAV